MFSGTQGYLDDIDVKDVQPFEADLHKWVLDNRADCVEALYHDEAHPHLLHID